jgi:hypothetical protein
LIFCFGLKRFDEVFLFCDSITEFCPDERSGLEIGMALLKGGSALHGIPVKYRSKAGQIQ